ncbi:MAG: hypothetical protein ACUVV5_06410 [Candidatus Aminicenantales bacterium]
MMKRRSRMFLAGLFVLATAGNLAIWAHPSEKPQLFQTDRKILIDGKLDDWPGVQAWPVDQAPDGLRLEPSSDLTVMARFTFDAQYFYAAVEVKDNILTFPNRGSLFGDSLHLALAEPSAENKRPSFIVFGFTLRDNEPFKIVLNRDGELFPQAFTKDIQFQIVLGGDKKSFVAEAAIPWTHIPSFRPFLQPEWAINVEYTDVDAGKTKSVQLVSHPSLAREAPARSWGMVFSFVPRVSEAPEFQVQLEANHFYLESDRKVRLAVQSPSPQRGWQLTMVLSSAQGSQISKQEFAFDKGMTVIDFPLEIENQATGHYDLSLGIIDDKGVLKFTEDKEFFLVEKKELDVRAARLNELSKSEFFEKDEVFRESLPTLEIRLKWVREFMDAAPPFAPLNRLEQWSREINELFKSVEGGRPALFPNGQVVRLAYRSSDKGMLKSYAAFIPEWYDPKSPLPLFVSLSGGSQGEQALTPLVTAYYGPWGKKRAGDLIFLAPEPEDASAWNAGKAGEEAIDCISHLKKLYKVNEKRVFLDGSGRGAYEVLKLSFLNSSMFRGVIMRPGEFFSPTDVAIEELLELAPQAKGQNILIVQGQLDQPGPPVEKRPTGEAGRRQDARDFAAKLKALGMNVRVIEAKADRDRRGWAGLEGGLGGHRSLRGDLSSSSVWDDIASWLKELLGESAVFTKPPKEQPDKEREKK